MLFQVVLIREGMKISVDILCFDMASVSAYVFGELESGNFIRQSRRITSKARVNAVLRPYSPETRIFLIHRHRVKRVAEVVYKDLCGYKAK